MRGVTCLCINLLRSNLGHKHTPVCSHTADSCVFICTLCLNVQHIVRPIQENMKTEDSVYFILLK